MPGNKQALEASPYLCVFTYRISLQPKPTSLETACAQVLSASSARTAWGPEEQAEKTGSLT